MTEQKIARDLRPGDVVALRDPDFPALEPLRVARTTTVGASVDVFWQPNAAQLLMTRFGASAMV